MVDRRRFLKSAGVGAAALAAAGRARVQKLKGELRRWLEKTRDPWLGARPR